MFPWCHLFVLRLDKWRYGYWCILSNCRFLRWFGWFSAPLCESSHWPFWKALDWLIWRIHHRSAFQPTCLECSCLECSCVTYHFQLHSDVHDHGLHLSILHLYGGMGKLLHSYISSLSWKSIIFTLVICLGQVEYIKCSQIYKIDNLG